MRRAFTLIELLVVIAILAILISILIPSLSHARHAAKATVCSSNMRGLMQAVFLYANDHQDAVVSAGLGHGGTSDEQATWINLLRHDYGGNTLIARCPTDTSEHWQTPIDPPTNLSASEDTNGTTSGPILRRASYGTNYYTVARIGGRGPYKKLGSVNRSGTTIFMVELVEIGPYATADHVHPELWWSNPRKIASEQMSLERHLKKANYTFFDGHVDPHVFEDTYLIDKEKSSLRGIVWKRNLYDPNVGR